MPGGFEVLRERGFIKQCSDEEILKKALDHEQVTFYAGFDPTYSSLHVGHLVPLFAMSHLQKAGHKPIALVGGGTARIGDPSGKTEMRQMLTIEAIKQNALALKEQISRFIDFSDDNAVLVDNADWLAGLNYIEFLREIGRHFSVNRMLSFETYKMRLESGLSFIEFNYQLLQSYDYLVLFRKYGCTLQIGGDDQWGNIVSGMELIRRVEGADVYALTHPLVTRADGKKMGKTEKGALFLDPGLTEVYDFYQYWVNIPDQDVEKFLLLYTYLPMAEVKQLAALKDNRINTAKEILAYELTSTVHGREAADKARQAARALFKKDGSAGIDSMPSNEITLSEIRAGMTITDFFSRTTLFSSKSEARRLIMEGGRAYVNDTKVEDINSKIIYIKDKKNTDPTTAIYVSDSNILQAGKKKYFRTIVTED
jgi:tyrosyl-tRNA synthetase